MHNEEISLIKNLFYRLKEAEISSNSRDQNAEKIIKNLLDNQPNSPYYMIQTILIQEEAIKKLNAKINLLENKIISSKSKTNNKGFFSNIFGRNNNENDTFNNKQYYPNNLINTENNTPTLQSSDVSSNSFTRNPRGVSSIVGSNNNNSFLGNALQTATGVAGGVVMANMLTSLFHNSKNDDSSNSVNESSSATHLNNNDDHYSNSLPENNTHKDYCAFSDDDNVSDSSDINDFSEVYDDDDNLI
ncbi:Putative uncharacterized protein Yba2 [Buchnera aphidicola (Neophyllaphis podocarpi)]|uniref:DUF2076 domain-containing protein n=1 Tax=Buchnera aphidicola TaxID=9 RepID=UPI003464D534